VALTSTMMGGGSRTTAKARRTTKKACNDATAGILGAFWQRQQQE
jgi:hypothetical protein